MTKSAVLVSEFAVRSAAKAVPENSHTREPHKAGGEELAVLQGPHAHPRGCSEVWQVCDMSWYTTDCSVYGSGFLPVRTSPAQRGRHLDTDRTLTETQVT